MGSRYAERNELRALVEEGKGEIEAAVVASQDGILLEESGANGFSDMLAALGAALAAGVDEAFRLYFSTGVSRVTVALEDGRMMVVKPLPQGVLCALTKREPRLGLIYYLLDRFSPNGHVS